MSGLDLVRCPSCGLVTYPTSKGNMRRHQPGNGRRGEPDCPGSGQPGKAVERVR